MGAASVVLSVFLGHLICSQSGYTQAQCTPDYFGTLCQYTCLCTNNQCKVDGNCMLGSKCLQGWFGPACQYSNLALLGSPSHLSPVVIDEDDTTCNPYKYFKSMSVSWPATHHFSWLRLVVDEQGVFDQITVIINNNGIETTCADLTRVVVDNRTQDIHCPNSVLMSEIQLKGLGVMSLCSLYISGGRNVATMQNTSQSSIFTGIAVEYSYSSAQYSHVKPDNAVDGNRSPLFKNYSCSHTKEEVNPTWYLSLSELKLVNRYMVYNRDFYMDRISGFILESYDENEHLVFQHPDNGEIKPSYQIIDTETDRRIQNVKIYLKRIGTLTLCEVELYGDSICPRGQYGRECEHNCNCDVKSDSCFVSTGGCPSGCPAGFYGEGCRKECSVGTYGKMCANKCSEICQGNKGCDSQSGVCKSGCKIGHQGPMCDKLTHKPITEIITTTETITTRDIITETWPPANQTASTAKSPPVRQDFQCHLTYIQVYIPVDLVPNSVLTLRDPSCELKNNGTHHTISFDYDQCGTSETFYPNSVNVENAISVHLIFNDTTDITFVDDYTIPLQCTVDRSKILNGAIEVLPREGITEHIVQSSQFYMKEFTTAEYNVEITEYPVKVPLNRQVFFELAVKNRTSSNIGIRVEKCDASPTPNLNETTSVSLIRDGCADNPAVKLHPSVGIDSFRFSSQAFHFSSPANINNLVYVHCTVSTCTSGCDFTCPPSVLRKRRSAGRQLAFSTLTSGSHVVANEGK